jgi:hypothetical protein
MEFFIKENKIYFENMHKPLPNLYLGSVDFDVNNPLKC